MYVDLYSAANRSEFVRPIADVPHFGERLMYHFF